MIEPYGSKILVDLTAGSRAEEKELAKEAARSKSIVVEDRFLADCELLAVGALTPLKGFMGRDEVHSVVKDLRLGNGRVWGVPIVLMVDEGQASSLKAREKVALLDSSGRTIALMRISDKFRYSKKTFCREVFRTDDASHPGVFMTMRGPEVFLGGTVMLINRPLRKGISGPYFMDPVETRREFTGRGWSTVVAFHTRNPIHRAHEFLIKCAMESLDGAFIHPIVGETKPDDIPADIRIKCYEVLIEKYFNPKRVLFSVLSTYMRYAGPREALTHAIMRRNFGCTHFIVGRDHAGVGGHYGTYDAQQLVSSFAGDLGINILEFENVFYCRSCNEMATTKTCPHDPANHIHLSGTRIREMLREGRRPPLEFSRKEVVDVLMKWVKNKEEDSGLVK